MVEIDREGQEDKSCDQQKVLIWMVVIQMYTFTKKDHIQKSVYFIICKLYLPKNLYADFMFFFLFLRIICWFVFF